jgi:hypothetical protein
MNGRCWFALILVAGSLALLAGCSDQAGNRREIAGKVTLKGQPLDQGSIEFTPLEPPPGGDPETKSGAEITNGRYEIPREDGLVPGKYLVRITSGTPTPPLAPGELPGPSGAPSRERIPAQFNVRSQLERTVTESGPNQFDFDIP